MRITAESLGFKDRNEPKYGAENVAWARLIIPVIMSGVSGARLWPSLRESMPEQSPLLLDPEARFQTMFQRLSGTHFAFLIVVATYCVRFVVAEQLASIQVESDIALVPERLDPASVFAVTTRSLTRQYECSIALIFVADDLVFKLDTFVSASPVEAEDARVGLLISLSVTPTTPAIGYGYIQAGTPTGTGDAYAVERLVESFDHVTVDTFIAKGHMCNIGNSLFPTDTMSGELRVPAPEVLTAAESALENATENLNLIQLEPGLFFGLPISAIAHAVMRLSAKAGVLEIPFPWADIGTWNSLWPAAACEPYGCVLLGKVEPVDAHDGFLHSDGVLTAVVGLRDAVVATGDAVLIKSLERSGEVETLVSQVKAESPPEADYHLLNRRSCGSYQRFDFGPRFQLKRIRVKPGQRLCLQKQFHRAEHWVVVCSTGGVMADDQVTVRHENEAAYLPIGSVQCLPNPGKVDLEMVEVQTGSYTGEDEIVRFEVAHGR